MHTPAHSPCGRWCLHRSRRSISSWWCRRRRRSDSEGRARGGGCRGSRTGRRPRSSGWSWWRCKEQKETPKTNKGEGRRDGLRERSGRTRPGPGRAEKRGQPTHMRQERTRSFSVLTVSHVNPGLGRCTYTMPSAHTGRKEEKGKEERQDESLAVRVRPSAPFGSSAPQALDLPRPTYPRHQLTQWRRH